ncbi:hypothetical protein ES708_00123 [subsurface metagenome]
MIYFVVSGAPRSGTSILQQILNTNSQISCFHEYDLYGLAKRVDALFDVERFRNEVYAGLEVVPTFYSPTESAAQPAADTDSAAFRAGSFDPAPIPTRDRHFSKIIDAIFAATSGKSDLRAVGDKSPNVINSAYLDGLLPLFPGLRVLLIVRSPINVIKSSLVRAAAARDKRDAWHIGTFDEALDEWVRNWEFAARISNSNDHKTLILKYEDLRSNFDGQMRRISDFLSVSAGFSNLIEPSVGTGETSRLAPEQEARISERMGGLLDAWATTDVSALLATYPTLPYIVNSNEFIGMSGAKLLPHVLRGGFYPAEEWGAWSCGTRARVVFKLRGARPVENVWIDISFTGYVFESHDFVFGIAVNSGDLEIVCVEAATALGPVANIGRLYKVVDGLIELTFSIPRPKLPGQEPQHDSRALGLYLKSIRATIL